MPRCRDVSLRFGRELAFFSRTYQRWCSCFALSFIFGVRSANGFSSNPENAPSIAGSRFAMAATNSKMKYHLLHSVSRPEKVGHLFITGGSTCPVDVIVVGTPARWASVASLRAFPSCWRTAWVNCSTVAMFDQHDNSTQSLRYHVAMYG